MTEDNKFEEFLRTKAQSYNTPPVRVPRDEMWSAIQAKRSAGPRVVYGGGGSVSSAPARRLAIRAWLGAAAAALLLVATGVGIGRWTAAPSTSAVVTRLPMQPVVVEPGANSANANTGGGVTPAAGAGNATTAVAMQASNARSPEASRSQEASRTQRGATRDVGVVAPPRVATGFQPAGQSSAYQLTAVQHLSEAEALLTSFRTRSTADQQMDAQLGAWARQLLSNTRLLLDSPVANDPQRRPLLEDLELVLVQIVQLSPGSMPQDREMIEKTLKQDHVMTRLRTAIPAGAQRGS
jgi:hypothetical protein